MLQAYNDITSRITEKPKWWDSNGTPRYDDFHPSLVPDVYAKEAVLYRIECQSCKAPFLVSDHYSTFDEANSEPSLEWKVRNGCLHYGDPPRHTDNCFSGDTMNCIDRDVVEFWRHNYPDGWSREPRLEGAIQCQE